MLHDRNIVEFPQSPDTVVPAVGAMTASGVDGLAGQCLYQMMGVAYVLWIGADVYGSCSCGCLINPTTILSAIGVSIVYDVVSTLNTGQTRIEHI